MSLPESEPGQAGEGDGLQKEKPRYYDARAMLACAHYLLSKLQPSPPMTEMREQAAFREALTRRQEQPSQFCLIDASGIVVDDPKQAYAILEVPEHGQHAFLWWWPIDAPSGPPISLADLTLP